MRTSRGDVLAPASIVVLHLVLPVSWARFIVEPLNDRLYVKLGDLNLGGIFSITARDPDKPCSDRIEKFYHIQVAETMVYAIQVINKRLPVEIGYVITDACDKETTAAIQALRFLPHSPENFEETPGELNGLQTFKVIGVVGTDQSFTTRPVSVILNTAQIPLVSFWASDPSLGDKALYPNFLRVIYSDEAIIHAIVHFLLFNNFTYFTVLYEEDLPVIELFEELLTKNFGEEVCNPIELVVNRNENFEKIVDRLVGDDHDTRVVVVLAHIEICEKITRALMKTKTEGDLLWVGGDAWMHVMLHLGGPKGSITVSYEATEMKDFESYFRTLDSSTSNPWFLKGIQKDYNCTTDECIREIMPSIKFQMGLSLVYDAVMVYGDALVDFFKVRCSDLQDQSVLDCFHKNFRLFPKHFKVNHGQSRNKQTTITETEGWRLSVYQSEGEKGMLTLLQDYDLSSQESKVYKAIKTNLFTFNESKLSPETYCTPPCKVGEYRFYVTKCCWACKKCKENAIVINEGTECLPCPVLQWPNLYEGTTEWCLEIPPYHWNIFGKLPLFLFIFSMIGISTVIGTLAWYIKNRSNDMIKASSIELSCAQLLAFFCGFLGIPLLLSRPNRFNCAVGIMMFTVSINVSYVIMLFKAIRVHRIFKLSKKNAKISYTSQRFQISACFGFLAFEVSRFLMANNYDPVESQVFQPELDVRYTELSCVVPTLHMFLFLVYNFILLLACCVLAFKTQTLPTRFKESKYVAMCVMTTLVNMTALTPAYFTTQHRQTRILLLIVALLINHTTAYLFLFLTRILAVLSSRSRRLNPITGMRSHKPQPQPPKTTD